ncbi:GL13712 [Drosophila persimilis]|uniref:GL13712 n=1 Tax=Drosophila persimilis TaxID=7234 RepID=B4GNW5_DROPE|nr:GL13712 [Drosophila persimilis]
MLPSTGLFKDFPCPYFDSETEATCKRPFCHFKHHAKKDDVEAAPPAEPVPEYKPAQPKLLTLPLPEMTMYAPKKKKANLEYHPEKPALNASPAKKKPEAAAGSAPAYVPAQVAATNGASGDWEADLENEIDEQMQIVIDEPSTAVVEDKVEPQAEDLEEGELNDAPKSDRETGGSDTHKHKHKSSRERDRDKEKYRKSSHKDKDRSKERHKSSSSSSRHKSSSSSSSKHKSSSSVKHRRRKIQQQQQAQEQFVIFPRRRDSIAPVQRLAVLAPSRNHPPAKPASRRSRQKKKRLPKKHPRRIPIVTLNRTLTLRIAILGLNQKRGTAVIRACRPNRRPNETERYCSRCGKVFNLNIYESQWLRHVQLSSKEHGLPPRIHRQSASLLSAASRHTWLHLWQLPCQRLLRSR